MCQATPAARPPVAAFPVLPEPERFLAADVVATAVAATRPDFAILCSGLFLSLAPGFHLYF